MAADSIVHVIDPEGNLGHALRLLLGTYDIEVQAYADPAGFLDRPRADGASSRCLLLALDRDCESGIALLPEILEREPDLPVIAVCDSPGDILRRRLLDAGAMDVVNKSMIDAYVFTRLGEVLPQETPLPVIAPSTLQLPNGVTVTFRMMTPDDADIEQRFVTALSDRSRYLRFFSGLRRLPQYMLKQLIDPQFPVSYAVIATIVTDEGEKQIGVARYAPTDDERVAEFAVVVADEWQGFGIATQLMQGITTAAMVAGIHRLEGLVLSENTAMLKLAKKLGFTRENGDASGPSIVKVAKRFHREAET